MTYEISAELNLKTIIAESREAAQALLDFADRLTEIDEKYSDKGERMTNEEAIKECGSIMKGQIDDTD